MRRRILLGFFAALLAGIAWLHFTGAAGTRGMALRDMDWNGDGTAGMDEWLQSFYAVVVEKTVDGPRECSTYAWRSDHRTIRVDCRTVVKPAEPKAK
jgi:hypothetical protein